MIYDFYVNFRVENKEDVNNLTHGSGKYTEISDVLSRILLLNTAYGIREKFADRKRRPRIDPAVYAKVGEGKYSAGLKTFTHSNKNYNDYIACRLSELNLLGIDSQIDTNGLSKGSFVIEFRITLAKPFISQDDIPLYIIENPVRKDKVFGVPFTSAKAWKGNLRWTMMKIFLEPKVNEPKEFAKTRFQHTLLFGTEKGWGKKPKGWAEYLDNLCLNAKEPYRDMLKEFFNAKKVEDINLEGMLHFYPTFWDKIDMIVINPQDRRTKTGTKPIYFEVVPAGAKGFFKLLYVPVYHVGLNEQEFKKKIFDDLKSVVKGLKEMMLIYGFSAKKTIGFGKIKDRWDRQASKLEMKDMNLQKFGNFGELENVIRSLERP